MSDLQKAWAKAKLSSLEPFEEAEEEGEEEMPAQFDDDSGSASSASSTGTVVPSFGQGLFARPKAWVSCPPPLRMMSGSGLLEVGVAWMDVRSFFMLPDAYITCALQV